MPSFMMKKNNTIQAKSLFETKVSLRPEVLHVHVVACLNILEIPTVIIPLKDVYLG